MKKLFFVLILLSLSLSSCSKEEQEVKKNYNTTIVQTGSINDGDSYVGYTDSFNTIMLAAKMGGRITSINKEVGDKVSAGELVAELDGSEAKTGFSSTSDIITQLELLRESTALTYDKQIEAAKQKVNQVKTGIDMAQIGINGTTSGLSDVQNITSEQLKTVETQIEQAKTGLETAKLNLENTKDSLDQKKSDIYNNSKNAISGANILATNIVDFLDNFYGITDANKYKNDSYEIYIGAKNTQVKTEAENSLRNVISKFEIAKKMDLSTNENIEIALNYYNSLFSNDIRNLLKTTYSVLENSIASTSFPDSYINQYKTQTTTLQTSLENVLLTVSGNYFLGLKGSIDSIANFKKESKNGIDMLQKQVDLAQRGLDTLNQTYKQYKAMAAGQVTDISTKKDVSAKQKELAENQLAEALASVDAYRQQKISSLKQIDAQIEQVRANKDSASVMIDNSKITSPISGTVIKKMAEVGQVVGGGMPVVVVATDSDIKVVVSVPDEIKQNTFVGDKVSVEIEGFDKQVDGTVSNILPTLDPITKKTQVEIKVLNIDNKIKIGSYTKVYFSSDKTTEKQGLVISNKAIISDMLIPAVYVLEQTQEKCIGDAKCVSAKFNIARLTNIKIIKQNDNFSLIEGLKAGDKVITDGKENIFDGEVLGD